MIVVGFITAAIAGTFVRYCARVATDPRFAIGTFVVNIVGSFVLGATVSSVGTGALLFGTAFLGSMTTFSTFVGELAGAPKRFAALYLTLTLVCGVGAAWLGVATEPAPSRPLPVQMPIS